MKKNMGFRAIGLRNKAFIIVSLLIALLSLVFLYNNIQCRDKELQHVGDIYSQLMQEFYNTSKIHVDFAYFSAIQRLISQKEIIAAFNRRDSGTLYRLSLSFLGSPGGRVSLLEEIAWYYPRNLERVSITTGQPGKETPIDPDQTMFIKQVIKTRKQSGTFHRSGEKLTYRVVMPFESADSSWGAVEFVLNPMGLLEGFRNLLNLDTTILIESGSPISPGFPSRFPRVRIAGKEFLVDTKLPGNLVNILKGLKEVGIDSRFSEVPYQDKFFILHHRLNFFDYKGQLAAKVFSLQDVTSTHKKIKRSIFNFILLTVFILLLVFLFLFHNIRKLMDTLFKREEQLKAINQQLEIEIFEREAIESELKTHRDHLEELIAEGTRELEIKSQEIEANEEKLRTITSAIQDAIVMADSYGTIIFWNPAAERVFDYSPSEMEGKDFFQLISPSVYFHTFPDFLEYIQSKNMGNTYSGIIEVECKRKNSVSFPAEVMISEVEIHGKSNIIVLLRDITQKKEDEIQKRLLLRAVEQSSAAIEIADIDGIITYVNPRFSQITGYSREEIIGKNTNILKSDFNPKEDYKDLWQTITAGKDWHGELYNRKKNGDLYWDSTLISPIKNSQGKITHFIAIKDDITERKNMEVELLTAKESAEAASRSKGEFLANMSHEIRTPMNAIIGMTELALGTNLTPEQKEYLEIVQQASRSLLKLLNDILDFSKVDAGKLILESYTFSLLKTIGETAKTMAVQAHSKNIELMYNIEADVPDLLIGDALRLRQIIVNLIGNAIKFTEEGEIILKVDVLEEGIENKILLHFVVSDTGIGIPEDQMVSIFEKFSQVDSSTTRKYDGTGLGLAISSKLIELMGGVIWVESPSTFPHFAKIGPGSTFHFTTLFEVSKEATGLTQEEISQLKDIKLLIVDDNETNRRFLVEILIKSGLKPEPARSGAEAIEMIKNKCPKGKPPFYQFIILDFRMPEMDGSMVLKHIRQELGLDIPIILLTSGIQSEDLSEFKRHRAVAHLLKPINSRELFETMLGMRGYKNIPDGQKNGDPEVENPVAADKGQIRVLVAEDNTINQRLIKRLLENEGYLVRIAGNGQEAVDLFLSQNTIPGEKFHLILMDIQMPTMDGVEATRRIRKIDKKIPIIALTAHAMKGDKGKFLSEGMDDYISKPIEKTLLFKTINKFVAALS